MLKREGTLALILFVDVLVRIFDGVDLDHDLGLVLTSTPDPTRKKQIQERKNNIQHGIDAMRIQE